MRRTMFLLAVLLIAPIHFAENQVNGETKIEIWDGEEWIEREVRTLGDLKAFTPAASPREWVSVLFGSGTLNTRT